MRRLLIDMLVLLVAAHRAGLALARRWSRTSLIILLSLLAFNAGRVSRGTWSSITGWGSLALEHVPFLAYLLILFILTAVALTRQ